MLPGNNSEPSPFYGYSAELVAEYCGVSLRVAKGWKSGRGSPPPSAVKLFALYAEGQVLTPEFKGYRVAKGQLIPPGRNGFTAAQIEAYELVYKIATTHARADVEAHLERMKLYQPDAPPAIVDRVTPTPRWMWDPFFNPYEGRRKIAAGTDQDRKD